MAFSFKKARLLLAAWVFVIAPSSSLDLAQERDIDRQLLLQPKRFEKSSILKRGEEKVPPIYSINENDEGDRRRLALSTAVDYPNPCLGLPANRVPELNSTNPANDGWTLALGKADFAYTGNLTLPFTMTLNGRSYSTIVIYNHGYLAFPGTSYGLLMGFLADSDTRGTNGTNGTNGTDGGYVWRKAIGNNKYAVAWDNVGYSDQQTDGPRTDKLNTFQILISDGTDASMGLGNNVCYCYQDMQWTKGPGQVGAYVEAGLAPFGIFSETGAAYDGGYGNNDGFDYLDKKSICFKASGSNIPPVAINVPENNRVDLDCGESVTNLTLFFLAPESGQPVTLTASGAWAGLTVDILQQPNQFTATATINWTPTDVATVLVTLMASDGIDTTTLSLTFTSPGPCCQNIPPVAVNVPENNQVDLACGQSVTNLTIFFVAPKVGEAVSLTTSGAWAGLTVDILEQPNQATATINWTPTAAAMVNVVLTASDGIDTATVRLTFTYGPCCHNVPPIAVNVPENNRVDLACGESLTNLTIFFLAPEEGQALSLTTLGTSAGLTVDISKQQTNQATVTINWTPTAAATVNVTLMASDGMDTTILSLTFTSPGPCCQATTAEIWNPTTNNLVQALVNGKTYCLKKYNLRAVPCPSEPVLLRLWNTNTGITLKSQTELVPPYFLWGDTINATGHVDVNPNPNALANGNYALSINAIMNNDTNGNNNNVEIRFKQACP